MELFTLGADRGAYGQRDVHEQARALTGFTNEWSERRADAIPLRPGAARPRGRRRSSASAAASTGATAADCASSTPCTPRSWSRSCGGTSSPSPPPAADLRALGRLYVASGFETRPLLEAILRHPLLYDGGRLVSPPVVYVAGLLRGLGRTVTTDAWTWICDQAGQRLFRRPNVAGWDYTHWLDTARWAARFTAVTYAMQGLTINPDSHAYPIGETPEQAVTSALRFWGQPPLSPHTHAGLVDFSRRAQGRITADWERRTYRVLRQNALRALIPTVPEWQAV